MKNCKKILFLAGLFLAGFFAIQNASALGPVFYSQSGQPMANDPGLYQVDGRYYALSGNELDSVDTLDELYEYGAQGLQDFGSVDFNPDLLAEVSRMYNSLQQKFEGRSYTAEALEFLSRPEVFVANHRFLQNLPIAFLGEEAPDVETETETATDEQQGVRVKNIRVYPEGQTRVLPSPPVSQKISSRLLVKFSRSKLDIRFGLSAYKAEALLTGKGLSVTDQIKSQNLIVAETAAGVDGESLVSELSALPEIESVSVDRTVSIGDLGVNDPLAPQQWALENTGQSGGQAGADIAAKRAWQLLADNNVSETVIIAVIDEGIDYSLPEFPAGVSLWDGSNCVDHNGQPLGGCKHGYDYLFGDKDPAASAGDHGNMVSGVIAAARNNDKGIAGLAMENIQIMALAAKTNTQVIKAINFAKNNGAKIINGSWGMTVDDSNMRAAISNFPGLFIASAGNDKMDIDASPVYPAAWSNDNIISVAATDSADRLAYFSNYGKSTVDIGAPGDGIYTTTSITNYYDEKFASLPGDWTFDGNWQIRNNGITGKALFPDVSSPYSDNADMTAVSPLLDTTGKGANISFVTGCDTEYNEDMNDRMVLEVSTDGGATFEERHSWDAVSMGFGPGDITQMYNQVTLSLPERMRINNFKMRFRWVTNDTDNDYVGCYITNFAIKKFMGDGTESYRQVSGTSFSAPYTAALAGLIWSMEPSLTAYDVKQYLINKGDLLSSLQDTTVYGKRINAYESLAEIVPRLGYLDNGTPVYDRLSSPQVDASQSVATVPFRFHFAAGPSTANISEFAYSFDKQTWNTLPDGDASAALSANWQKNGYNAVDIFNSDDYSFTFDTGHQAAGELSQYEGDLYVRFRAKTIKWVGPIAFSRAFTIDNKTPQITEGPTVTLDKANLKGTVTIDVADGGSGVDYTTAPTVKVTGLSQDYTVTKTGFANGVWTGTFNFAQADDTMTGTVNVSGFADLAGNLSDLLTGGVFTLDLGGDGGGGDDEPPVDVRVEGLASDDTPRQAVGWQWSANETDVVYRYLVNNSPSHDALADQPWGSTTSAEAGNEDGKWYVHVQAKHSGGSISPVVSAYGVLDTTPPPIALVSPPVDSKSDTVTLEVKDNDDLVQYQFSLDNATKTTRDKSKPMTFMGLSTGQHKLQLWGIDAAGNESISPAIYYWLVEEEEVIEDDPPASEPVLYLNNAINDTPRKSMFWDWRATGAETPAFRYKIAGYGSPSLSDLPYEKDNENVTVMDKNGKYYIAVQAKDLATGLESQVKTGWAIFDNHPPSISLTNPPQNGYATSYRLKVTGSDDLVGYRYTLNNNPEIRVNSLSDIVLNSLQPGFHSLKIYGIDEAGNDDGVGGLYNWTIYRTEPDPEPEPEPEPEPIDTGDQQTADDDGETDDESSFFDPSKRRDKVLDNQPPSPQPEPEPEPGHSPSAEAAYNSDEPLVRKVKDRPMAGRLNGKIVLRVEANGEAYYVDRNTEEVYYLGRPAMAFAVMEQKGVGISTDNLSKIPIGMATAGSVYDNDGDGLSNLFEDAIGTDKNRADTDNDGYDDGTEVTSGYSPLGTGTIKVDNGFAEKHKGKIFLQVEQNGEAWYINPADGKRYFLGRPADAFAIMRTLGLGISEESFGILAE